MGIPEQRKTAQTLREQVYGIEDTIKRVEPTIKATTRESMVTEGQRERMSVTQKRPLLERLGELSTNLGRIDESIASQTRDLSTKVGLFLQGQAMELEPLKLQYQATVDKAARLTTAFSTDASNQLNVYLTNVKRGWELEDQEREKAFALIQNESAYKRELEKSAAGSGIRLSGNESSDDILSMIGDTVAEELQYERNQKLKSDSGVGITWPGSGGTWNTDGSDWKIVTDPGGQPSASMRPPQMSAAPGTIKTTKSSSGQVVYWVMGQDGSWE